MRHGGAVVSGRGGDDPAAPLFGGEAEQLVQRAPGLERAGVLPALQLEPDIGAGETRERGRRLQGGLPDLPPEPVLGAENFGEEVGHGTDDADDTDDADEWKSGWERRPASHIFSISICVICVICRLSFPSASSADSS